MAKHIISEAERCLKCKNPKCKQACPIGTAVPEVIELFLNGDIKKAGKVLFENNPLSVVCSLVCHHEKQCEGSCIRGIKSTPIDIGSIEFYISDYYLDLLNQKPKEKKQGSVGVIGSGPAGLTIAFSLALKGYDVTIFEAHDEIGGVMRYGIPEFRLPESILDRLKKRLVDLGVKIRPNTLVGYVLTIEELLRDEFDALFIGTGVWKPNKLNIKGESLGHVHYAVDYLTNPSVYNLGNKVCVIGAGNVAMDTARTALRQGSRNIHIMYRKGMESMPARKNEIESARIDGVKFDLYKSPIEITNEGILYNKVKNNESSQGLLKCDSVIISIGQGPRTNIVSSTDGLEINEQGLVVVDEYGKTTKEGVFASGDVVTGAKTVVDAVAFSKKVAQSIEDYIALKYK